MQACLRIIASGQTHRARAHSEKERSGIELGTAKEDHRYEGKGG